LLCFGRYAILVEVEFWLSVLRARPTFFLKLDAMRAIFVRARATQHTARSNNMDWRDTAACLTADPELFFPVGNTGPAVDQIEKAKAVCGRCSVTEMCLQYALETNQDSGVWGGLSEDERRALKRRAARARRAS
jgi:WhiB family redox-sensing transcriptional regulator